MWTWCGICLELDQSTRSELRLCPILDWVVVCNFCRVEWGAICLYLTLSTVVPNAVFWTRLKGMLRHFVLDTAAPMIRLSEISLFMCVARTGISGSSVRYLFWICNACAQVGKVSCKRMDFPLSVLGWTRLDEDAAMKRIVGLDIVVLIWDGLCA